MNLASTESERWKGQDNTVAESSIEQNPSGGLQDANFQFSELQQLVAEWVVPQLIAAFISERKRPS
jgi:hypothetical protein